MYKIISEEFENDGILIKVFLNKQIIGVQVLNLSFNEDETPTFSDNGFYYSKIEFNEFIKSVAQNESHAFTFSDEVFHGFVFKNNDGVKSFEFIIEEFTRKISIIIDMNTEGTNLVADLKNLEKIIDNTIKKQREYYDSLKLTSIDGEDDDMNNDNI